MTTDRLRRVELGLSVGWLILLILSQAGGTVGFPVLIAGVVLLAGYWVGRRFLPRMRRAWRSARPRAELEVVLASPGPRSVERSAVGLSVLARLLERADLGAVTLEGTRLRLVDRRGEFAQFEAPSADSVTRSSLRLTTSSLELALLACDALAPRLGAMEFQSQGVKLVVDGTVPRGELERQLHDAQMSELSRLRDELDAEPAPKKQDRQLLN